MPSSSKKQHDFMLAIAHSRAFAKKAGVAQSVGRDFTAADHAAQLYGGAKRGAKRKLAKKGKR